MKPEKLKPNVVSWSLASIASLVYVFCVLLVFIAPEITINFFKYIFHGIDITQIASYDLQPLGIIIGFIEVVAFSFIFGWYFAKIYNYIDKKSR